MQFLKRILETRRPKPEPEPDGRALVQKIHLLTQIRAKEHVQEFNRTRDESELDRMWTMQAAGKRIGSALRSDGDVLERLFADDARGR